MARCKLTPELQTQLVECIESGMYYDLACQAVGISTVTFWFWMKKGKEGKDEQFINFSNAIKKAKGVCAKNALDMIKAHSIKEWTAAAWLLERRFRKYYGKDAKDLREVARLIKLLSKGEPADGKVNDSETKENSQK
jgi:hypothetical protein